MILEAGIVAAGACLIVFAAKALHRRARGKAEPTHDGGAAKPMVLDGYLKSKYMSKYGRQEGERE